MADTKNPDLLQAIIKRVPLSLLLDYLSIEQATVLLAMTKMLPSSQVEEPAADWMQSFGSDRGALATALIIEVERQHARIEVLETSFDNMAQQPSLRGELRAYLNSLRVTGDNIGEIRRSLFVPWPSFWNGWVREETANREQPSANEASASNCGAVRNQR